MQYIHRTKKSFALEIIATMLIVGVGFLAYEYISVRSVRAVTDPLVSTTDSEEAQVFTEEQLVMLAKIESLKLDGSIFKDEAFKGLQDWAVELGQAAVGKSNPFSPASL